MDIIKRLAGIQAAMQGTPGGELLHVATVDPEDPDYILVGGDRVHVDDLEVWLFDHEMGDPPVIILDR